MKPQKANLLLKKAKEVLNNNWTGSFTKPSSKLYPHQWNWDSGFIALGYANYDTKRAEKELLSLFEGQWKDGMLPHIVFNEKSKGYFPGPDYWNIKISKNAPENKLTSGITQPPTQAIAAYEIYRKSKNKKETKKFLKKIFPKILSFHRYLHNERDPENSGLATIIHPWESGFDNSPRWDDIMSRINPKNIPKYKRDDIEHVGDSEERPTNKEYDKFIYLIELMKKYKYDCRKIYKKTPFLVKDIVFNSILSVSDDNLIKIGKILKEDIRDIKKWHEGLKRNFFTNTCPIGSECLFYDFDLIKNKFIKKRSVSSLVPIYTGLLDKAQADTILNWLNHSHFCGSGKCKYPVAPSVDVHVDDFRAVTYWRGPIWFNVNWMIYHGLKQYGFKDKAKQLRNAMIQLVEEQGFYEYFDPITGKGLGSDNFSWTAALLIELLMEK